MRVSSVSLAVLSLAAGASAATKSTLAGLSAHLNSNKLTGFAGAFGGLGASTSYIKTLSAALASGKPITLLAPTNAAWNAVSSSYRSSASWSAESLAYHTIMGSVDLSTVPALPGGAAYTTLLSTSPTVHLIGGQSQSIVFTKNGSTVEVANQDKPPVVTSTSTYNNVVVLTISTVVDLPPSFISAISLPAYPWTVNTTTFVNYVSPEFPSLVTALPSVTVFVPYNMAILNALTYVDLAPQLANTVGPYLTDAQLNDLLFNHVISGSVLFTGSPVKTYTSAMGEPISFGTNGTNSVVYYAGELVANVLVANIVTQNGVVHIIDNMLNNFATDPTAASSYLAAVKATAKPSY